MKRLTCVLCIVSLLLSGCSFGERLREPVTFHYLCDRYQQDLCCVIASEEREASGHREDLRYLLHLYLMGPSGEDLVSALPDSVRLLSVEQDGTLVRLQMSDTSQTLSDSAFSLACACLTLTCLDISDAAAVRIESGERTVTMTAESLALYDTSNTTPTEEPQ